jgi:hypothetical protein
VAERKKELAILESTDCGKPIDESEWDMVNKLLHQPLLFPYLLELLCFYYHTQFEQCAWLFATLGCPLLGNLVLIQIECWWQDDVSACFEYYADLAEKLDERQYAPLELPMEQFKCNLLREPIGVVALITPWSAFYL